MPPTKRLRVRSVEPTSESAQATAPVYRATRTLQQVRFPDRRRVVKKFGRHALVRSPRQRTLTQIGYVVPPPPSNLQEFEAPSTDNLAGESEAVSVYEDTLIDVEAANAETSKGRKQKYPLKTKSGHPNPTFLTQTLTQFISGESNARANADYTDSESETIIEDPEDDDRGAAPDIQPQFYSSAQYQPAGAKIRGVLTSRRASKRRLEMKGTDSTRGVTTPTSARCEIPSSQPSPFTPMLLSDRFQSSPPDHELSSPLQNKAPNPAEDGPYTDSELTLQDLPERPTAKRARLSQRATHKHSQQGPDSFCVEKPGDQKRSPPPILKLGGTLPRCHQKPAGCFRSGDRGKVSDKHADSSLASTRDPKSEKAARQGIEAQHKGEIPDSDEETLAPVSLQNANRTLEKSVDIKCSNDGTLQILSPVPSLALASVSKVDMTTQSLENLRSPQTRIRDPRQVQRRPPVEADRAGLSFGETVHPQRNCSSAAESPDANSEKAESFVTEIGAAVLGSCAREGGNVDSIWPLEWPGHNNASSRGISPTAPRKNRHSQRNQGGELQQFYSQNSESQRVPLGVIRSLGPQTDRSDIIICIHPTEVQHIIDGKKDHEFRNHKIPQTVSRFWMYITQPVCELRYMAVVDAGFRQPGEIDSYTGLGNAEFNTCQLAAKFAYKLVQLFQLNNPVPLEAMMKSGWVDGPPQRYVYVPPTVVGALLSNLRCALPDGVLESGLAGGAEKDQNEPSTEDVLSVSQQIETQLLSVTSGTQQSLMQQPLPGSISQQTAVIRATAVSRPARPLPSLHISKESLNSKIRRSKSTFSPHFSPQPNPRDGIPPDPSRRHSRIGHSEVSTASTLSTQEMYALSSLTESVAVGVSSQRTQSTLLSASHSVPGPQPLLDIDLQSFQPALSDTVKSKSGRINIKTRPQGAVVLDGYDLSQWTSNIRQQRPELNPLHRHMRPPLETAPTLSVDSTQITLPDSIYDEVPQAPSTIILDSEDSEGD